MMIKQVLAVCGLGGMLLLSACAPTDLVIKPGYRAVGESRGNGGAVLLVSPQEGTQTGAERVQYVYGEIKDSNGRVKGNITGSVSSAALVRDALQQELYKAGYSVQVGQALSKEAAQGVVLSNVKVTLDELTTLVKSEAECSVALSLEIWKQGALVRKLTYGKTVSDFALKDRELLHQQLLQKALSAVMKDAAADIVTYLK